MTIAIPIILVLAIFTAGFCLVLSRAMKKGRPESVGKYEVYSVSEGRLTVYAGFPKTFDIGDIEDVAFNWHWNRTRMQVIMKIRFNNGKRRRRFYVFRNSVTGEMLGSMYNTTGRDQTIQYLMDGLTKHGIACIRER